MNKSLIIVLILISSFKLLGQGQIALNLSADDLVCGDSTIIKSEILYSSRIEINLYSEDYGDSDHLEFEIVDSEFNSLLTTNALVAPTYDTLLYLKPGKYYFRWLNGGALTQNPNIEGKSSDWISKDGYVECEFIVNSIYNTQDLSFIWDPIDSNDSQIKVSVSETTYYSLSIYLDDLFIISDSILINVAPLNVTLGDDINTVCGASIQFNKPVSNFSGDLTYTWSPSIGLNATDIAQPTATVNNSQTYKLSITNELGCTATDSVYVSANSIEINAGVDKSVICGNSIQLDQPVSNYSGSLDYSWSPSIGLDASDIARPTVEIDSSQMYTLTVTNQEGCTATDSVYISVNSIEINAGVDKSVICGNSIQLDQPVSNYSGSLDYSWSPSIGLDASDIARPTVEIDSSQMYTLTVTNEAGCTAVDSIYISLIPLEVEANDASINCGQIHQLSVNTNLEDNSNLTYHWFPENKVDNPDTANPNAYISEPTVFKVIVTTPNNCIDSANIFVDILPTNLQTDLCIVTVHSGSEKNQLIWNFNAPTSNGFGIYRETNVTGEYTLIDYVDKNVNSYIDLESSPIQKSNRYRISVIDSCGSESQLSESHKTIHLTINKGIGTTWNLIWDGYEGFSFGTYRIYRSLNGKDFELLTEVASNLTSFSDIDVTTADVAYQIEVVSSNNCGANENGRIYQNSLSRSNVARSSNILGSTALNAEVEIFPNPAYESLNIESSSGQLESYVLLKLTGQIVQKGELTDKSSISLKDISRGVYLLKINSNHGIVTKKIVKK